MKYLRVEPVAKLQLALERMTSTERVDGKVPQAHLVIWLKSLKVVNPTADFIIHRP